MIANITLTLYVKHYKDEGGVEHINIRQIGTGGFEGNTEDRTLDWTDHATEDPVFGPVGEFLANFSLCPFLLTNKCAVSKSRRVTVDKVENDWQRDGWLPDTYEHGALEAFSKSDTERSGKTWAADQIWGFAITEGERFYTRRVYFTGPEKQIIRARFVYDYSEY